PPIAPAALCGPMRGAILGAALLEGWADTADEAARLLDSGAITLRCTHDHGAVGPMAGIISPTMPLCDVRDATTGTVACCPLNEGIGAVLRFGAYDPAVLERLRWIQSMLGPALDSALQSLGALPPVLAGSALPAATVAHVLRFLADNDQFFLNVAMAACKSIADGLRDIPHSTIVTAMSRNGVEFGLRVSGLGAAWFTAPAPVPDGLYFPGYGAPDANPDMGDSAIVETVGLGGMAMIAAPAVVGFVGLRS